jgi:hypothetical protein
MKNWGIVLIIFGSGLAAFGISGFGGSFSYQNEILPGLQGSYSGSFGWSPENKVQIVVGVVSLMYGMILRKDSK